MVLARQVSRQAAGKGIARAGGIVDVLERIGPATEESVRREEQAAVLPLLDRDVLRARAPGLPAPALMRLVRPVNCRASPSFRISMSTRLSSESSSSFAMLIQRSIVSAMTNRGFSIWSST